MRIAATIAAVVGAVLVVPAFADPPTTRSATLPATLTEAHQEILRLRAEVEQLQAAGRGAPMDLYFGLSPEQVGKTLPPELRRFSAQRNGDALSETWAVPLWPGQDHGITVTAQYQQNRLTRYTLSYWWAWQGPGTP